jgi:hypothetical protein
VDDHCCKIFEGVESIEEITAETKFAQRWWSVVLALIITVFIYLCQLW